jgi:flagellar basal-body rod protein FlgC
MSAQRTRINVVSANIANAKTTHTAEGGPYKKQQVVFEDVLLASGKKTNSNDVQATNNANSDISLRGVGVKSIIQSDAKPVMRYEPAHPDANEQGYVAYPDINPVIEMVDLIEATRSYEANVASFNTHKNIDSKTLDILNM